MFLSFYFYFFQRISFFLFICCFSCFSSKVSLSRQSFCALLNAGFQFSFIESTDFVVWLHRSFISFVVVVIVVCRRILKSRISRLLLVFARNFNFICSLLCLGQQKVKTFRLMLMLMLLVLVLVSESFECACACVKCFIFLQHN